VTECRRVLAEYTCNKEFDEEYSVYCISGYQGDPEVYLSLFGDKIVAFLKNENEQLDEEEVTATLASYLKYGKDDITIVDWDGAFIFDAEGDFMSNIELFRDRQIFNCSGHGSSPMISTGGWKRPSIFSGPKNHSADQVPRYP